MKMTLNVPSQFKTARLLLRKPALEDAEALFHAYMTDPDVSKYTIWTPHLSVQETSDFLRGCLVEWQDGSGYAHVFEEKDNPGQPIGMINMHRRNRTEITFGYVLAKDYWSKGYLTEALSHLVSWAGSQKPIWRLSAYCDTENIASARVMEKSGMTLEGTIRRYINHPNISADPRDCFLYSKVR